MSASFTADDSFQLIESNDQFIVINKSPGVSFHTENDVLGVVERELSGSQLVDGVALVWWCGGEDGIDLSLSLEECWS